MGRVSDKVSIVSVEQGWANVFTRKVTIEKNLKPMAALIGRAKKSTRPQMFCFFALKFGEEQKNEKGIRLNSW